MEKKEVSTFVQAMLELRKHEIEEASHHINEERNKRINLNIRIMVKISITKSEYDAMDFCAEEITSCVEGGANDEYVKEANKALTCIASIRRKYQQEVKREKAIQDARAAIKKTHPEVKGEFYRKMVKVVAKQILDGNK